METTVQSTDFRHIYVGKESCLPVKLTAIPVYGLLISIGRTEEEM